MRAFLQDRIRLVRELLTDGPAVAYGDLVLILTAVISACAAIRWPGRGIDRKRFVELLVRESPESFHASWISVPALINTGHVAEADTAYGKPGQSTRIFRDDEIDMAFEDAKATFKDVASDQIKRCSYAVLIYEWLRCGFAHEYCAHENTTELAPSRQAARVSYIGRGTPEGHTRKVLFHLDYLIELAEYHASNLTESPKQQPAVWWIEAA